MTGDPEYPDEELIFKQAVQMESAAARSAYIKRSCGDDARLLARMETLINAHENDEDDTYQ